MFVDFNYKSLTRSQGHLFRTEIIVLCETRQDKANNFNQQILLFL